MNFYGKTLLDNLIFYQIFLFELMKIAYVLLYACHVNVGAERKRA